MVDYLYLNFLSNLTLNLIEPKLYMNNHRVVPYTIFFFCVDQKFIITGQIYHL